MVSKDVKEFVREFLLYSSEYLKNSLKNRAFSVSKKDEKDFVTSCDVHLEERFLIELDKRFPNSGIIAEEKITRNSDADLKFIIDPIDGTNNFVRGVPAYGTAVAVFEREKPVYAGVVLPSEEKLYEAERGKGAYCNGIQIRVSGKRNLAGAFLFLDSRLERINSLGYTQSMFALAKVAAHLRMVGAAVYNICYVSDGRIDASVEFGLKKVDYPAGCLIVEEAGGTVLTFSGKPWYTLEDGYIISSATSLLAQEIREAILTHKKTR